MSRKKLRYYWQIIVDIWYLFKQYSSPDGSNEFWAVYTAESDRLNEKYQQSEFYQDLARAVTKELLRIEKEVQK